MLCGQGPDLDGIDVPVSWPIGEPRTIEVRIEKEDPRPGRSGSSTTSFTLTAIEATDEGTIFEWLAGETDLSALGIPDIVDLDPFLDRIPRERIVYLIDDFGVFAEVQNVDEIRANALQSLDVVRDIDPRAAQDGAFEQIRTLYTSMDDSSIVATFAERPLVFHAFDGFDLDEGEIVMGDDVLPNAFGGEPFPAIVTVSHVPGYDADGCEVVVVRTVPDPTQFGRILFETLNTTFDGEFDPEEDADEIGDFAVENVVTLQFDNSMNSVRRIVATQEVTAGGQTRLDTTTMTAE